MVTLFYILTFFPIIMELSTLANPSRRLKMSKEMKEKDYDFDQYTDEQKNYTVMGLCYFIWLFIGLFSSQWILFVSVLLSVLLPKKRTWLLWIDAVITLLLLIFILVNHYHLKVDVWGLIIN